MSDPLPQTIGIDISKASLDCHAHPAGAERQFANTAKGHKALIAWLRQWPVERIAYEATATYHRALETALADSPCVKLNPEPPRRFAQATGTLAKTGHIDAMLLARMAATLQPAIMPARSLQQVQMADLINARDGLVRDRTALKNRVKNLTITLLKSQCRQRLEQIDRHIEALDAEIATLVAADATLARRHQILTSIAGVGTLTANQLIATVPELGSLENKQAAALAGLAPVARQSGQWKGKSFILAKLAEQVMADKNALPSYALTVLEILIRQIMAVNAEVAELDQQLAVWHAESEASRRLAMIPGLGIVTATAIAATVTDAEQFSSVRQFAAWLGLTPQQHSTGGKIRLGRISKQGDRYLRRLLIVGATSVMRHIKDKPTPMDEWIRKLSEKKPFRLVSVALVNKLARIAWFVLIGSERMLIQVHHGKGTNPCKSGSLWSEDMI